MDDDDRISIIESNLARQLGWIAAADSKVSFAFTVDTAMLGILAGISPRATSDWSIAAIVFVLMAAVGCLLVLLFLSFVTFPRTKGPNGSLVYFGGVVQHNETEFKAAMLQISSESYIADLSSQCHRNAVIASHKFKWLQIALTSLYLSILPWGIAIFLLWNR